MCAIKRMKMGTPSSLDAGQSLDMEMLQALERRFTQQDKNCLPIEDITSKLWRIQRLPMPSNRGDAVPWLLRPQLDLGQQIWLPQPH